MPAAMLKRLEREAAEKEKRKEEKRRKDSRLVNSPTRPGRAIVRRNRGVEEGDIDDMLRLVASQDESDQSNNQPSHIRQEQRELIVISDNLSSESSQAHEDKLGEQTLARLYDGDFETIIAGRRAAPVPRKHRRIQREPRKRLRRPALGLAKLVDIPSYDRPLVQARLYFPTMERGRSLDEKRQKKLTKKKPGKRPAIRLDDHVIFATADFDFDEEDEPPKRRNNHVTHEPNLVDTGVGKARSWANFDKFPIDFGISPLPSGLYCHADTYIGDGRLSSLVRLLQRRDVPADPTTTKVQGIELRSDMSRAAITSVVTLVFDHVKEDMLAFANETSNQAPRFEGISFMGSYISMHADAIDGDTQSLRDSCCRHVKSMTESLDTLTSLSMGKHRKHVLSALFELRLILLDLACRLGDNSHAEQCGIGTLRHLLQSGFDKTISPLKAILRGTAETAEIAEPSTVTWVAVMHILDIWGQVVAKDEIFLSCLEEAYTSVFRLDQAGPIAAERVWCLIFGLCALSQFDISGRISRTFEPCPRWQLVRRAIGLIKISHSEEAEEKAHIDQLQGRDKYIKTMIARCVRLSAVWKWDFGRASFSVVTKDIGVIFKHRQHRNLPTEPPVDYPDFITRFDMSLTAAEDTKRESAFELYLRLVCVAASDIIGSADSLAEAHQAEKDVQRLIMSIIPVSPVKFDRVFPPTLRQLGQLINRYSTMIAACYFSPSLVTWLLANSRKWAPFESADCESRQVSIRGLLYVAVACRHHSQPLDPVVARMSEILSELQAELDEVGKPSAPARGPTRVEIERTMVLVVACFRQIILHHSYDVEQQLRPTYPDPSLLHESWTARVFALDVANDLKCGTEIVATIQAFLDTRSGALPRLARQRREARESRNESQDEYSFGIDFSAVDLVALGGEMTEEDPIQRQDVEFAIVGLVKWFCAK